MLISIVRCLGPYITFCWEFMSLIPHRNKTYLCNRKNFKLSFCMGIALAAGVQIYMFRPMRITDAILPGSPPRGNIKCRANNFSPSSRFLADQLQDKPANMTEYILSLRFLTCSLQDRLSFSSLTTESPLTIMRRAHPIYGPLVSGKSVFHHSSFLLNQRILGDTNWIFSTPDLTSAFWFLSWR